MRPFFRSVMKLSNRARVCVPACRMACGCCQNLLSTVINRNVVCPGGVQHLETYMRLANTILHTFKHNVSRIGAPEGIQPLNALTCDLLPHHTLSVAERMYSVYSTVLPNWTNKWKHHLIVSKRIDIFSDKSSKVQPLPRYQRDVNNSNEIGVVLMRDHGFTFPACHRANKGSDSSRWYNLTNCLYGRRKRRQKILWKWGSPRSGWSTYWLYQNVCLGRHGRFELSS